MKKSLHLLLPAFLPLLPTGQASAQNPIILDQFTADPSARVFEGRVYVYPSHDIPREPGTGKAWFRMSDYHVFSSENLTDWKDHGVIVSQEQVPWVDATTYSMWAPDCIYKDGRYYFYFPAIAKDTAVRGMKIGVAISDKPYGPFIPEPNFIKGLAGIDPNPFIDHDGQAYLYWAGGSRLRVAKLKENMLELATEPQIIENLLPGFKEGPYLFERKGIYYLTFPFVAHKTEELVYAMGNSPMGPFKYAGVIMDESPTGCWTNHQSIIEYQGHWYLFYHHHDLSPEFDKNRSIRVDEMYFNDDGTIRKVIPTLRGVGITAARDKIQIDRYSAISEHGSSIAFLDDQNRREGWRAVLSNDHAWFRYDRVDFGRKESKSVVIKAASQSGGVVEIRLNKIDGPLVARITIPANGAWNLVKSELVEMPSGIQDMLLVSKDSKPVEVDWVKFE
jgi:hypothetical protein